jgi:hypothetical protein
MTFYIEEMKNGIRIILFSLILCFIGSNSAFAQDKFFLIEGKASTNPVSPPNEILILVYKNGSVTDRINPDKEGSYSIKLDFQKDYKISFTKKGMVSQSFTVNTSVDKERIADAFYPKEINVNLFADVTGFDKSKMPEPMGKLFFQEDINDFDWDENYQAQANEKFKEAKELALAQIELNKLNANAGLEAEKRLKEEAEKRKKELEDKEKADEERLKAEKEKKRLEDLAKKEAEEKNRIAAENADKEAKEKKRLEDLAKKEAEEKNRIAAENADREAKEKKRLEDLAKKEAEEKNRIAAENADKEAKEKAAAELKAQKEKAEQERLMAEAKSKEEKEKIRLEALAKKEKEEKEKETLLAEEKAKKEKEKAEALARKEQEKKAEEERIAEAKKKAAEDALAAAEKAKLDEIEAVKNKAKKLEEEKENARLKLLKDEENRVLELARQEELFKKRTANFTPVMGIYTSTINKIGEKQAFGYINFGNGLGNQDLTKEEYDEYAKKYKKK